MSVFRDRKKDRKKNSKKVWFERKSGCMFAARFENDETAEVNKFFEIMQQKTGKIVKPRD